MNFSQLIAEIVAFRDARDWKQFHTPRNLATGLSIEAGELLETMLWLNDAEVEALLGTASSRLAVEREVADVLIYALLLCHTITLDPAEAIREKLLENARKYPAEASRGSAVKYTHLEGLQTQPRHIRGKLTAAEEPAE